MTDPLLPDQAMVEIMKRDSGIKNNITTDVSSFDESGFSRETETKYYFGGGKVILKKPQEAGELKMNAKLTRVLWDQMFWGGTGSSFTAGAGLQDPYRIVFLVSTQTGIGSASQALSTGYDHYRKVYAECYMTSFNPKLEVEGMLEAEVTFKVNPSDSVGAGNLLVQLGDVATGSGFGALANYTSSVKW